MEKRLTAGESMSAHQENSSHDEAALLLPWYANGTLEGREKMLVEEHVRSCIVCRRALSAEYRTLDVFRNESPLDQSVQAGFERLHDRIVARHPSRLRSRLARLSSMAGSSFMNMFRSFPGERLRPALIAAPLVLVTVGFGLMHLAGERQWFNGGPIYTDAATATEGYRTLSSPSAEVANADDVHVIFARYTSTETIHNLLKAIPARIVAGPDNTGVYTVRLTSVSGKSERQAAIAKLRNQPKVIFAEAAQPMSVSGPGRVHTQ
jgi:hypothetical protein